MEKINLLTKRLNDIIPANITLIVIAKSTSELTFVPALDLTALFERVIGSRVTVALRVGAATLTAA